MIELIVRRRSDYFVVVMEIYNIPEVGEDLIKVFEYNGLSIKFLEGEKCCGMPKFEMGDIEAVMKLKDEGIGFLYEFVKGGRDIVSLMPSCTFILKEKWRLLFEDEKVKELSSRIYDSCEYLVKKYREKNLNLDFKKRLGKIVYHVACHTRDQNVGIKAVELFRFNGRSESRGCGSVFRSRWDVWSEVRIL